MFCQVSKDEKTTEDADPEKSELFRILFPFISLLLNIFYGYYSTIPEK